MNRHKTVMMGLVLGLVLGVARPALAEDASTTCPICKVANDKAAPYPQKAGSTLVRGALNTAFGWTELLVQPTEEVKEGGNLVTGIGKGVGFAAKRTVFGLGELLTFWTPKGRGGHLELSKDCPVCMGRRPAPHPSRKALEKGS